jgi:hypothetical protein
LRRTGRVKRRTFSKDRTRPVLSGFHTHHNTGASVP